DSVFQEDVHRVFLAKWLFAGHASAIPRPGDYFLFEVANESFIVIRDARMQIHAVLNVCRHRGSRICLQSQGNARNLVCPYHQWVYGADGVLLKARLMPADFDLAAHGLWQAHTEILEDLIFVCSAEEAPDFQSFRDC